MNMQVWQFAVWWSIFTMFAQVLHDCNPVPNPGRDQMTDASPDPSSTMRQLTLFDCPGFLPQIPEGEGCCRTTPTAEADARTRIFFPNPAKSGTQPPAGCGPNPMPRFASKVNKRSFLRACRRAIRDGQAGYHGRVWKLQEFPKDLVTKLQSDRLPTAPEHKTHRLRRDANRLKVLTWNPGGLSQSKFQEFRWWLRYQNVDVVIIPETRWSFENTWTDDHWSYVHSSAPQPRTGGVLVMISTKVAQSNMLGYDPIISGRLLHVRVHFEKRAIDILAVYQWVLRPTSVARDQRSSLWRALDTALLQIPNRNMLICAGDFNCTLPSHSPWTGSHKFSWHGTRCTGHIHGDQGTFMELLQRHGLVALTGWNERSGPSYIHGEYATRIDHILIRLVNCDGLAKDVQYLSDAAILPMNSTHHIPLCSTIRSFHLAFQVHALATSCTYNQRLQCRKALFQDSEDWRALQHAVGAVMTAPYVGTSVTGAVEHVHDMVKPVFQRLFPTNHKTRQRTHSHPSTEIISKWDHKHAIRRICFETGPRTLRQLFMAWNHWRCFLHLQRQQQKQARIARLHRFQELCHDVHRAAAHHDLHQMFQIINRYSSRKPLARARLRTSDGQIADQYQAHSIMTAYVRHTWQGPDLLDGFTACAPGIPFSHQELVVAIERSHPNKSVAQPFLPAVVWRSAPEQVATFLMEQLTQWWSQYPPIIPQSWKNSWLFFLPKPGKPNTSPEHLRPISLMEPLGKVILGLIASKLKAFYLPRLCRFPSFGFLPLRSTTDAINRVVSHCRTVRTMVQCNSRGIHQQIAEHPKYVLSGGISLFLDLTRAFDLVDRRILFQHMYDLETPADLLCLCQTWHETDTLQSHFSGSHI